MGPLETFLSYRSKESCDVDSQNIDLIGLTSSGREQMTLFHFIDWHYSFIVNGNSFVNGD